MKRAKLNFPKNYSSHGKIRSKDGKIDRHSLYSTEEYIREFDRLNGLVRGGTLLGQKLL